MLDLLLKLINMVMLNCHRAAEMSAAADTFNSDSACSLLTRDNDRVLSGWCD